MTARRPLAVLLLFVFAGVQAQDEAPPWESVPGPYGGEVVSLAGTGGRVALASSPFHLYRTDDGGGRWTRADDGTLSAPSGNVDLVAGPSETFWTLRRELSPSPLVYRTDDGGQAWTEMIEGLPPGLPLDLAVGGDGTAYAATEVGVYKASPGAVAWTPTAFDGPAALVAVAGETILAATPPLRFAESPEGRDGSVYRSTDGGASWEAISLRDGGMYVDVVALATLPGGVVLAGTGHVSETAPLFRSEDGGQTWSEIVLEEAGPYGFAPTFHVGPQAVYVGDHRGSLRSVDGGRTFEPVGFTVTAAAAGPDGSELLGTRRLGPVRSDDAGWTARSATAGFGRASLGHVAVSTTGDVYAAPPAILDGGSVYRSADGGGTWERTPLPFAPHGVSSFELASGGALLLGPQRFVDRLGASGGGLYRSTDGGRAWDDVSPAAAPAERGGGPSEVPFLERDAGGVLWAVVGPEYVLGGRAVYRSADDGRTWEERTALPDRVLAFTTGPGGTLWASVHSRVYRSADGAATWDVVLDADNGRVSAIGTTEAGSVVASGLGTDYRSPDGGRTWRPLDVRSQIGPDWDEVDVFIDAGGDVLFAAVSGSPPLARSVDGGATWTSAADGVPGGPYFFADLALDNDRRLWAALGLRGLYRTTRPVATSVQPEAPRRDPAVSVSAFPNPARREVAVAVASARDHGRATVDVIDALGRRVLLVHDGPLRAGRHTFSVRSDLPSGLYFVRVSSKDGTASIPLAVVR